MTSDDAYQREAEESAQGTDLFEAPVGELRLYELEESAQGVDLFQAPGGDLQAEDALDQAEASGWIPEKELGMPSGPIARARAHHSTLREAMGHTEQALGRPVGTSDWGQVVGDGLDRIQEALMDHVAEVEGTEGLLADVELQAPRLTVDVDLLRREHETLQRSLEQARTTLRGAEMVGKAGYEPVRRRVMTVLGRLMLHRQRAADLVYEAYNVDMAASD